MLKATVAKETVQKIDLELPSEMEQNAGRATLALHLLGGVERANSIVITPVSRAVLIDALALYILGLNKEEQ